MRILIVFILLQLSCVCKEKLNRTKNDVKEGCWIIPYPESKKINELIHYNDGLKNGLYKKYYENGDIAIKGYYKRDKKNGKWIYYNSLGQIQKKIHFKMDSVLTTRIYTPANPNW